MDEVLDRRSLVPRPVGGGSNPKLLPKPIETAAKLLAQPRLYTPVRSLTMAERETEHAVLDERIHVDPHGGLAGNFFAVHYDNKATQYYREPSTTNHADNEPGGMPWYVNPVSPNRGKGYSQVVRERRGEQSSPVTTVRHNPFESRLFANTGASGSWQLAAAKEPKGIGNPFGRPLMH